MVLTYVPAQADGRDQRQVKGTLPGKATADAIVATWIGPKPAMAMTSKTRF